jgi:hypothetical protein
MGGPRGLTAAVNGASEGLQTAVIESFAPGGQAGTSTRIENYTGFPFGVSGDELASGALQQAKRLGAEIVVTRRVEGIDPADLTVTLDGGDVLRTKSIVLAMGVEWRRLEVDSIDRFVGSGVYYGAARSDAGLAQGNSNQKRRPKRPVELPGIETDALQSIGCSTAGSFHFGPAQSRSLPAGSLSGLDGAKSGPSIRAHRATRATYHTSPTEIRSSERCRQRHFVLACPAYSRILWPL